MNKEEGVLNFDRTNFKPNLILNWFYLHNPPTNIGFTSCGQVVRVRQLAGGQGLAKCCGC